ncbi:hypothetical protein HPP92_001390 [Vanilla planifolia]|uniref:Pentatricopeptide repeat-containing protein n=1 Tax=Vanilla planifolia TaxID=51239 RepID=A0A835RRL3_VANPL|nr:hypothetical protein HPP92_001390 [Vanilla planifolia]
MVDIAIRKSGFLFVGNFSRYLQNLLFQYSTAVVANHKPSEIPRVQPSERCVLQELSTLLPFHLEAPKDVPFTEKSTLETHGPNANHPILLPDEKLRGIFLQTGCGKSSLRSALTSANVNLTLNIFADVLNKGNMNGASMVLFLNWALAQPNLPKEVNTYYVVLKALGRRKFFVFMAQVLLIMKKNGVKPNSETLEIVLDSYVRSRQVQKAIDLFKSLEDIGVNCDTKAFNILLHCLCRRSHVRVACSLLNSMEGKIQFNLVTFNEIIGGWAKYGMVDKVERYWMTMMMYNLNPDCQTFCHLIVALRRDGRMEDAIDTFMKMEELGCIPNTSVYNAMIHNLISVKDLEEAINWYRRMLDKNCNPDANTFKTLIMAFLKARRVSDALEFFDKMIVNGITPSTRMITDFIELLCNFGPPYAAMMIYKRARKVECEVSLKAYKLLFKRLARFGKGGMLLKLWEEMLDSGHVVDNEVYEHVIDGLCNIGQVNIAVLIIEEAIQKGCCVGSVVYDRLNKKLLALNKVETAYKLFLKVKEARKNANLQRFWRAHGWHF